MQTTNIADFLHFTLINSTMIHLFILSYCVVKTLSAWTYSVLLWSAVKASQSATASTFRPYPPVADHDESACAHWHSRPIRTTRCESEEEWGGGGAKVWQLEAPFCARERKKTKRSHSDTWAPLFFVPYLMT